MIIDFITIEQGGDSCYKSGCKMVIVNSEQWASFWKLHVECVSVVYDDYYGDDAYYNDFSSNYIGGKRRTPEIDFDYYSVIVVVEERPTTCYLTEILSVKASSSQSEDRSSLSITFRCQIPLSEGNRMVGHTTSSSYHLIKIPKIDTHKVVFKEITTYNNLD